MSLLHNPMKNYEEAIKYTSKVLDAWLPRKIQYAQVPGIAVGIVYKGKLVYGKGFGHSDTKTKTLVTPKTCFRIASISKTFTSVAVMQLVEHGKLSLDDKVEEYLPWFKAHNKNSDSNNISIRQILSHTGGLFRDGDTPHWEYDNFPDLEGLKSSVSNKSLVFENLTRFKYSNFGFALLGEVIKKVSGISYEQYVTENILKKLRMGQTTPDYDSAANQLATGYSRFIPGEDRKEYQHCKTIAYASATGFVSSVSDLAKWLGAIALDQNGSEIPLINRESKKELVRGHWATGGWDEQYGLGFMINGNNGRKIIGHNGSFAGFNTRIALDNENGIGVIVLINTNTNLYTTISRGIFEIIYTFVDEKDRFLDGEKLPKLDKYEGLYRSRWGDTIIVGANANLITFGADDDSPLQNATILRSEHDNTFRIETNSNYDSPGESAVFIFDDEAKKATEVVFGASPLRRVYDIF